MNTSCSFARSVRVTPALRPLPSSLSPSPSFSLSSSSSLSLCSRRPPLVVVGQATCLCQHRARVCLSSTSSLHVGSPIVNGVVGNGRRRATAAMTSSQLPCASSSLQIDGLESSRLLPGGAQLPRHVVPPSFRRPQGLHEGDSLVVRRSAIASSFLSLITPPSFACPGPHSVAAHPLRGSGSWRLRRNTVGLLRAELADALSTSSSLVDLHVPSASSIATTRGEGGEGGEVILQCEGGEGSGSSLSAEREKTQAALISSEEGARKISASLGAALGAVGGGGERGNNGNASSSSGKGVEVEFSRSSATTVEGAASVYVKGAAEAGVLPLLTEQRSVLGAAAAAAVGVTLETATGFSLKGGQEEGGVENGIRQPSGKQATEETVAAPNNGVLSMFDLHRPAYHLQPPNSWMNDPNGPIYINGLYHLFYQHNPSKAAWDWGICWGHAVSADLVHWEHRPLALTPTPGTYDQDGIFSGCCVNNEGVPTILYTGVQTTKRGGDVKITSYNEVQGIGFSEVQCIATFGADGKIQKHAANPVINAPPPGLQIVGFRDPFVWKEGQEWFMLLGSGIRDVGGTALLYKSPDLIRWEYVQPICMGNITESGMMWECPLLINFGKWHMLCVSPDNPANPVLYWVGVFEKGAFTPKGGVKRLDLGNVVYAPNCCVDNKGRQLLWGWVQEVRSEEACVSAGYAGCLTLPRVLSMNDEGVLFQEPPEEIKLLRTYHLVKEGAMRLIPVEPVFYGVRTGCLEIEVEVDRGTADAFGIDIREMPTMPQPMVKPSLSAADGMPTTPPLEATRAQKVLNAEPHEGVLISYDFNRKWLEVSWWQPGAEHGADDAGELVSKGGEVVLREGESLKMRVFLDRSVVEVFVNGLACLTTRMYRAVIGVALLAKGGDAELVSASMWEMGSMWDSPVMGELQSPAPTVDSYSG